MAPLILFAFDFIPATLVCHVAIALCNIYNMRTGKYIFFLDVMSLTVCSRFFFSLVLSDFIFLNVTKPYVLVTESGFFLVTIGECQN